MSTKIQNYLNLHLFQKEQILGCYIPQSFKCKKQTNPKRSSKLLCFVLDLGMPYYKEGCKFRWFEEDRVLKHKNKI